MTTSVICLVSHGVIVRLSLYSYCFFFYARDRIQNYLILYFNLFFFFFKQKTAYEMIWYWSSDVCSSDLAEREHQRKLEAATVAFAQPGEMQPERDFNMQGEETSTDRIMGRAARRGVKWFSFDMPVDSSHPMVLVVSYYSDEWRKRTFDVLVEGQKVGDQTIEKGGPVHFFDAEYRIPADLVQGKQKAVVRFQATNGNEIAAVFGLRMIRADAER